MNRDSYTKQKIPGENNLLFLDLLGQRGRVCVHPVGNCMLGAGVEHRFQYCSHIRATFTVLRKAGGEQFLWQGLSHQAGARGHISPGFGSQVPRLSIFPSQGWSELFHLLQHILPMGTASVPLPMGSGRGVCLCVWPGQLGTCYGIQRPGR